MRPLRHASCGTPTRELLARVQVGEGITITVRGRPAAVLGPYGAAPDGSRVKFVMRFASRAAGVRLREDNAAIDESAGREVRRAEHQTWS